MKKIKLTQGKYALVDDEDYPILNQFKWHLSGGGYAVRSQHIKLGVNQYKNKHVRMHRLINKTPKDLQTDHINGNKLDNRRCNLRSVNASINGMNRGKTKKNTSGYKGVYWDTWSSKWKAEIKVNYKKISLGRYSNIKQAVKARKLGEQKYHAI